MNSTCGDQTLVRERLATRAQQRATHFEGTHYEKMWQTQSDGITLMRKQKPSNREPGGEINLAANVC